MRLSLDPHASGGFSGTWSVWFGNGDEFSGPAATVQVVANSYGVTLYVAPQPPCAEGSAGAVSLLGYELINTVITANRLTAVAGRLSCSGLAFGSVDLSRL